MAMTVVCSIVARESVACATLVSLDILFFSYALWKKSLWERSLAAMTR